MKIIRLILICFLLSSILTGCTNNIKPLEISPYNDRKEINVECDFNGFINENEVYSLSFTIKNTTDIEILYGTQWYLEVWKEDNWYTINYKDGFLEWDLPVLTLGRGEQDDIIIPLSYYYDMPLPGASYRMVQIVNGELLSLEFIL